MTVTQSRHTGFGPSVPCFCCRAGGPTRRRVLAAGAGLLLASRLRPIVPARADTPVPALDRLGMSAHGDVAKALVWDFGRGGQAYAIWPEPYKARLRAAFALAWDGKASGLVDPPPDAAVYGDTDYPVTAVSGGNAFALHVALVANSLVAEIGRRVPWSVAGYSDAALAALFDGRQTYARSSKGQDSHTILRVSVPAPPETCLEFLRSSKMIGADRRATIVHVLSWCRNLWHFTGANAAKNNEEHWHYRGMPPASRLITGTTYTGTGFGTKIDLRRHFTAGCWGTTGFLISLLRTVNIPVQELNATQVNEHGGFESHSAPYFMSEQLCLSHGDDPYDAYCRARAELSPSTSDPQSARRGSSTPGFRQSKKHSGGGRSAQCRTPGDRPRHQVSADLLAENEYAQDVAARQTRESRQGVSGLPRAHVHHGGARKCAAPGSGWTPGSASWVGRRRCPARFMPRPSRPCDRQRSIATTAH